MWESHKKAINSEFYDFFICELSWNTVLSFCEIKMM